MAFRAKRVRAQLEAEAPSNFLQDIDCHIDEDDLVHLSLSDDERKMRSDFFNQVDAAFSALPDINGVLHGVRLIRLGKEGSRSGHFPSIKNAQGGMGSISLPVESRPEMRYALELERDRDVKAFRTQAIKLVVPGVKAALYPDFLILDRGGQIHLKEVKQDANRLSQKARERIGYLSNALQRWGVSYSVVDVSQMPEDMMYANLLWLYRKINAYPTDEEMEEFLDLPLATHTMIDLTQMAKECGLSHSVVPYALLTGELKVNWSKTLNDNSEVSK